jgi:hypothetical protein
MWLTKTSFEMGVIAQSYANITNEWSFSFTSQYVFMASLEMKYADGRKYIISQLDLCSYLWIFAKKS